MFSSAIKGTKGSGAPPNPPATNPPWRTVEALYHFDEGTFESLTTGSFNDQSSPPKSATISTPLNSFPSSTANPFSACYSIDCRTGTSPAPRLLTINNGNLTMGTGTFTIEFFCFLYSQSNGSPQHYTVFNLDDNNSAGRLGCWYGHPGYGENFVLFGQSGGVIYDMATRPPVGQWIHVAFVRTGTTMRSYLNGVQDANVTTITNNFTATSGFSYWGTTDNNTVGGGNPFDGLISNLRITRNVAVYTGNFTVPTSPLEITQSAGTNISAITGTDCKFLSFIRPFFNLGTVSAADMITYRPADGVGGSAVNTGLLPVIVAESPFGLATRNAPTALVPWSNASFGGSIGPVTVPVSGTSGTAGSSTYSIASNADFGMSNGDYTIEFWAYIMDASRQIDFVNISSSPGVQEIRIYTDSTNSFAWTVQINGVKYFANAAINATQYFGQWVYIALSRQGLTATRFFVNGNQLGTTLTLNYSTGSSAQFLIGNPNSLGARMASLRVLKGVGLYNGAFAVPTGPNINTPPANCKLLLNQGGGMIDQTGKANLVGSEYPPYDSTTQVKYGASSFKVDAGTNQYFTNYYLDSAFGGNIRFGRSSFTIECFVWIASPIADRGFFQINTTSGGFGGVGGIALGIGSTNNAKLFYGSGSSAIGTANTLPYNTWNHVAVVRTTVQVNSPFSLTGTIRVYINGIQDTSLTFTDNTNYSASVLTLAGYENNTKLLSGYIDEFRISKYPVYTANFTPPTTAFPDS